MKPRRIQGKPHSAAEMALPTKDEGWKEIAKQVAATCL